VFPHVFAPSVAVFCALLAHLAAAGLGAAQSELRAVIRIQGGRCAVSVGHRSHSGISSPGLSCSRQANLLCLLRVFAFSLYALFPGGAAAGVGAGPHKPFQCLRWRLLTVDCSLWGRTREPCLCRAPLAQSDWRKVEYILHTQPAGSSSLWHDCKPDPKTPCCLHTGGATESGKHMRALTCTGTWDGEQTKGFIYHAQPASLTRLSG